MAFRNEAETPAADFSFDTTGVDPDSLQHGATVTLKGDYHLEIEDVVRKLEVANKKGEPCSPKITLVCTVLEDAPKQSPKGSKYYHDIFLAGKGGGPIHDFVRKRTSSAALSLGIAANRNGQLVDAITGKPKLSVELWESVKGKQYVGRLVFDRKKDDATGKWLDDETKIVLLFDEFIDVRDPRVAHVPKNEKMLAAAGLLAAVGGEPGAGGSGDAGAGQEVNADL